MSICKKCKQEFIIYPEDKAFYQRINVPEPTLCPDCRNIRRLVFRNERVLYKRKCNLCSREIISIYNADSPHKVYCSDCWFSDRWSALDYGQDFDFSQPFFPQYQKLYVSVPRLAIHTLNCENSDYTNYSVGNKNCYLAASIAESEDCYYGRKILKSKDSIDNNFLFDSELMYQSVNATKCYNSNYLENCSDCSDCNFCFNCYNLRDCFLCSNLRNKQYCLENKQYSQEEYEEKIKNYSDLEKNILVFAEIKKHTIRKYAEIKKSEKCTGDYLENCDDCFKCFELDNAEKCRYVYDSTANIKDCMDCNCLYLDTELCYEMLSSTHAVNCHFSIYCNHSVDLDYCDSCVSAKQSFASISLKKQENCFFNKKYSVSEYTELKKKIIQHMIKTGEYGEFFSEDLSPFKYSETRAQDFYPQKQNSEVKTSNTNLLSCINCRNDFQIISQEKKFYLKQNIIEPQLCPECRFQNRFKTRNLYHLYQRQCTKCGKAIETTYSENRPEKIYCEKCYNKEIY